MKGGIGLGSARQQEHQAQVAPASATSKQSERKKQVVVRNRGTGANQEWQQNIKVIATVRAQSLPVESVEQAYDPHEKARDVQRFPRYTDLDYLVGGRVDTSYAPLVNVGLALYEQ